MNALIIALLLLGSDPAGRIRGHAHFPACFPPPDLQVCAEGTDGSSTCTSKLVLTEVGLAYTLEVPPGWYLVYSASESTLPGYRAYYSEAVVCGLSVECDDHEPIPIEVRPNETVSGIDPDDWFAPKEPVPLDPAV
jgi:hypothetical protein